MILKLTIDDETYEIDVDEHSMQEAEVFYTKMDADLDQGWQMSRTWVEKPDLYQRCQIVADRVLGAFHSKNQKMVLLMSGYILSRVPQIEEVVVDTTGDITLTEVVA
ncbi:hypothetical protein MNBD_GAMMA13-1450 [hydrothermal vent metagenome]|uniref:Uncharacterized protein n=1 Tax=hydrothermal vent metagenome TaxID=652676 RepID=A0A3B0ZPX4_9ZZZZ